MIQVPAMGGTAAPLPARATPSLRKGHGRAAKGVQRYEALTIRNNNPSSPGPASARVAGDRQQPPGRRIRSGTQGAQEAPAAARETLGSQRQPRTDTPMHIGTGQAPPARKGPGGPAPGGAWN